MSKASGLAVAGLGLLLSACQMVGPDYHLPEEAAVHRPDFQGDLAVDGKTV
ncbi:MAG: TolC family protein, partial [Pseudomonas sp.]